MAKVISQLPSGGSVPKHNNLLGLNEGDYLHLTQSEKAKLDGIQSGAEVNVNADWNAVSGDAQILNKPTSFPPSTHTHTKSQITDFAHTHPISDVTGLPTALDDLQLNKEDKGVNSSKIAYVESVGNDTTAELGNFRKPFLTIDAALDALPATGGVINIGVGSFMSPTKTKIKSYVKFFGSGKPVTNSIYTYTPGGYRATISSPTKLIGGTILLGSVEVSLKDGVEFHKLGVDSGLDYCNAYKAGVAQEGLIIVQEYNLAGGLPSADRLHQLQTNSPPRTGIVVNNVSALCKSANSAVHAILIENTINAKISNVSTYYGIHGLVIKSIGCNLNGLDAHGHAANGLIFKANDYAYGGQNSATNIYITSIEDYDGGGIHFVSEHSILSFVTLTNFNVEFTTYGIMNTSTDGVYTEGHTISNGVIYETQGVGIDMDSTFLNSVFSNIDQRRGESGYLIYQADSIYRTSLCFINCKASENTNTGWNITTSNLSEVYLNNCVGQSGVLGSIVSGNVFGTLYESSSLTGSMNKSAIAGDFIASIDSKGVSKKSSVTFDGAGGINVTGLLIKKSASNNIGDGSNVVFDNGASGGLQRQIVYQLNASNNIDLWYYNGSVFSLTGIVFKNTGVIKSKVYTVSTLPAAEKGDTSFVSDALSPIFGNTVVGGGAVGVPVYHDGISWKVG